MERTLSQEERQRRAEELYYRRRNEINSIKTATVNINSKKNYNLLKKIIIQVLICVGIYVVIYNLQGNSDNFSVDSISYLKNTMSYDINIESIKKYFTIFNLKDNEKKLDNTIENILHEEINTINTIEATLSASEQVAENIKNEEPIIETVLEEASSVSQMEEDAKYIKNNFSFIKPLNTGTVTSRFGLRNPTTPTVPKYHTGIDIGVPEGTKMVSAMEGTVELVSSVGDYRKSHKNSKWRCNDFICTL